jgi:hypothetical protein
MRCNRSNQGVLVATLPWRWLTSWIAAILLGAAPVSQAGTLTPPPIPATGAYVGAWINPLGLQGPPGVVEIEQLPLFNLKMGQSVAILHLFMGLTAAFPTTVMSEIEANGSMPMVDLGCGNVSEIAAGHYDTTITSIAQSMKQFAKPVFMRWYYEMNLPNKVRACNAASRSQDFVAAWRHIWTLFHRVGATNVAFVWCPSARPSSDQYYPGDQYVDWVGGDGFDLTGDGFAAFTSAFKAFYYKWRGLKPIMIGATGATNLDQAAYIGGMTTNLPLQYPDIKGIMYFDAPGPRATYNLTTSGMSAMRIMINLPYFVGAGSP